MEEEVRKRRERAKENRRSDCMLKCEEGERVGDSLHADEEDEEEEKLQVFQGRGKCTRGGGLQILFSIMLKGGKRKKKGEEMFSVAKKLGKRRRRKWWYSYAERRRKMRKEEVRFWIQEEGGKEMLLEYRERGRREEEY